jgi:hypothetical protein
MGRADSPLRDRVIFVLGAPRSGTTWLVTLLATHSEIAGVESESHLFDNGVDRLFDNFEGRDPYNHLQSYLDRDELVDLLRDLCDGVLGAMRAHVSPAATPPFVVEKTPVVAGGGGLELERKRECYPDAWYVHIVRDREAVAQSLMRAPWMADRSHAACAGLWDDTVGSARATLGDHPRYREVSYEELRADPAAGCQELFEWLGVDSGEASLERVRLLSRDQYSDLGAVEGADGRFSLARVAAVPGRLASASRAALARRSNGSAAKRRSEPAGAALAFTFVRAMRERDADTLRSLTAPSLDVVYRGADGDRTLRGEDGRAALVKMAEEIFARRYVGEWWAAGGGLGDWWTRVAGRPFWTIFFSSLGGDATRVDVAIGLVLEEGLVRRALVFAAGPLAGRPVAAAHDA